MQLFNTERDTLLKPLQIVSGIVERRHTYPILANLLIRKNGPEVSFLSTDTELQITTKAALSDGDEQVATTVGARKLLDILRAVPDGEVSLSLADQRLKVKAGKSNFSLQTLEAKDYPLFSVADDFSVSFSIAQKELKHLIGLTHFSMAQQDIRYYLNGMLFIVHGNQLMSVATDGHRLACFSKEVAGDFERQEVIVPRKTITEVQRLLDESDEPMQISLATGQIKFVFGQVELVSKLVEGKFPDFQRVIPKGHQNHFLINRELLQRALQRVAILTSDKFKGVRCIIESGLMKILSNNADQEEAREELEIAYAGEAIDIGFNVTYLLDVLANLKVEQISVSLGDAASSALITVPEFPAFSYVVMPMRI